jgi:hypothetical protein
VDDPRAPTAAGTKHGIDELLAFFAQLAKTGFKADTIFLRSSDEYIGAVISPIVYITSSE